VFAFFTSAAPDRVWSALTDPTQTRAYLHGLALLSDWTPGSPIVASFQDCPALLGEVLCAQPPHRLSYLVGAPEAPAVYVTWRVRVAAGGTICSLQIDEADASDTIEIEDIWLPVLAALQRVVMPDEGLLPGRRQSPTGEHEPPSRSADH
jgi:uncharacterized protein YndB with AHSA1/START domain